MKIDLDYEVEISEQFKILAQEVFRDWRLKVNDSIFKILEIEFYYYSEMVGHLDGFTYPHQRPKEEFRFHFGGVDITLNSDQKNYGGILIRSVKNEITGEVINGPRRLVSKVFEVMGNIKNGATIRLEHCNSVQEEVDMINTVRVGLKNPNRNTPNDDRYRESKYRYITELVKTNKVADKEKVAKEIDDPKRRYNFLGYNKRTW